MKKELLHGHPSGVISLSLSLLRVHVPYVKKNLKEKKKINQTKVSYQDILNEMANKEV